MSYRCGAGPSLGEPTDGHELRNYFQSVDVQRYGEIVDRVLLRSIGAHLGRLGYSAVEFQEAFTQTINYLRGSPFSNSAVGPDARVDARHSTSVTVGRLTDELSALGGWLQENDGDEARAAVRELDGLTAEVVLDRPAVHSRWATVRTRAAAVLGTGANITQITDLVMTLFGP